MNHLHTPLWTLPSLFILATLAAATAAEERVVTVLSVPAFPSAARFDPSSPAVFVEVSSSPNEITDRDAWFTRNGLSPPRRSVTQDQAEVAAVLEQLDGVEGVRADTVMGWFESAGDSRFLVSGGRWDPAETFLIGFDTEAGTVRYTLDFRHYAVPPGVDVDTELYTQEPTWAVEMDGVLYVAHRHRGYARDSGGKNGYITAFDVSTMDVLWRSPSLVANAATFVVHGDYLVTGYGFTAEPDFLYLLRRKDGTVTGRIKLKTAPEYILKKDGLLFVRCYDTDAVFRVIAD